MCEPIERYLLELARQLRWMPPDRRAAELREIRGHLEALVARRMDEGDCNADAVATAQRQFGSPRQISRGLKMAANTSESWWLLAAAIMGAWMCFSICGVLVSAAANAAGGEPAFRLGVNIQVFSNRPIYSWYRFGMIDLAPALAGLAAAFMAPRRALLSVLGLQLSIVLLVVYRVWIYGITLAQSSTDKSREGHWCENLIWMFAIMCLSAYCGSCCIQRLRTARRVWR